MERVKVRVGMKVWEERVEMEAELPAGPARVATLLPVFQRIADGLVGLAAERAAAEGRTVSCRKGCGACCRQLVPVSEVEARRIGELVEAMPEPRREEIRARFRRAKERLAEAGLLGRLLDRADFVESGVRESALAYFRLGIPCPFLDDESCSIHPDRPITCREYLVTSPPELCRDPDPETIERVEMPGKMWTAVARADAAGRAERLLPWVPLALAPDWAAAHPDTSEARPVEEVFQSVLGELGRRTPE